MVGEIDTSLNGFVMNGIVIRCALARAGSDEATTVTA
jgi:hypothetical protein